VQFTHRIIANEVDLL